MRDLARRVAEAYLDQRKQLEYPLLKKEVKSEKREVRPIPTSHLSTSPFLLEIGVEELPANDVDTSHAYFNNSRSCIAR